MFPFTSAWMHLFNQNRMTPSWAAPKRPADEAPSMAASTGEGRTSSPWEPDDASRRSARNQGLVALGSSLLEGSSSGDFAGSLARGLAGFSGARDASLDRDRALDRDRREEARQAAADARATAADTRAAEGHTFNMEAGREELDAAQERRRLAEETRTRTGKSAEQMAADIQGLAAAHPDNKKLQVMARRAIGYADGDEDDVDKLTGLHEQMTNEAFWSEDYNREAGARRTAALADIAAGVANDPRRDDARADAELGIRQQQLALERERADRPGYGVRLPTPAQRADDVVAMAERIYNRRVATAADSSSTPLPGVLQKWRQEAYSEAERQIDALYQSGSPSAPPITVDAQGNPIR